MKLLFNLEVIDGNRIRAQPSDYLKSLPREQQINAVSEFLEWAQREARENRDLQARAEAEIGIATAREFLDGLEQQPRIITDSSGKPDHE
jgi:hypothetical protein